MIKIKMCFPFDEKMIEYKNVNQKILNDEYNQRIKENIGEKNFNYNIWCKKNNIKKVEHDKIKKINSYNIEFEKYLENDNFIEKLKLYNKNPTISKIIKSFNFKKNIIYLNNDINFSCCLEFPIREESIILMENKPINIDMFFDLIHEFSHAIFNDFKYKKKYITNLEVDEKNAYLIQEELIKNCFPQLYFLFLKHLRILLLTNSMFFEFENYLYSKFYDIDKSFNFKTKIFKNLLEKYEFKKKFAKEWIYEENLFVLPFLSAIYVRALENVFNNMKNNKKLNFIFK